MNFHIYAILFIKILELKVNVENSDKYRWKFRVFSEFLIKMSQFEKEILKFLKIKI